MTTTSGFRLTPPQLGATHLNHICDNAFDARQRGLPRGPIADIAADFDAYRAYELGWYRDLSEADYLDLAAEDDLLEAACARGQELPNDDKRRQVIRDIFAAGPWTFDPDTGKPVRKDAVASNVASADAGGTADISPTNSLAKTASWVIRDLATGAAVLETFEEKVLPFLNTTKYEAVPILQHLQELNQALRKQREEGGEGGGVGERAERPRG